MIVTGSGLCDFLEVVPDQHASHDPCLHLAGLQPEAAIVQSGS